MVRLKEGNQIFEFPEGTQAIKFDETTFFLRRFNVFPNSKAVDFIAVSPRALALIEVKNCRGDEGNCRWRISPNNHKRETSRTLVDREGRDSLDIEVSKKVAMTLAALVGARSLEERSETAQELKMIQEFLFSSRWKDENRQRYVILHLDGDFASYTRSKKMIMADLQRSMQTKLRWLNCKVSVVDADTYCRKVYTLISERN